jgi:hypothetical protein
MDARTDGTGAPPRARRWRGAWRRKKRLTPSGETTNPIFGLDLLSAAAIADRAERASWPRWALAAFWFVAGLFLLFGTFVGDPNTGDVGALGWMRWGLVGFAFGIGLWSASVPYAGRPPAARLRIAAVVALALPILAHLAGLI